MTLNNLKDVTRDTTGRGNAMAELRRRREDQSGNITNLANLPDIPIPTSAPGSGGGGGGAAQAAQEVEDAMKSVQSVFDDATISAQEFEVQLAEGLVKGIDSVSNAWSDFVMRGFKDFKSFADAVFSQFKNLIAQMIATAAKNRIMISLGLGGGGGGGGQGDFGTGGSGIVLIRYEVQ